MGKKLYAVLRVDKERTVKIFGLDKKIELSWIDGQIGAMPIFKDSELAYTYAKKYDCEIAEFSMTLGGVL